MVRRSTVCKFPVARIKKIMQADEDVGKVAAATPVVVSKSLELFIHDVLEAMVKEARASKQRKLTPILLKRAVHNNETLDFLKEIVDEQVKAEDDGPAEASGSNSAEPKTKKRKVAKEEDEEDD